MRAWQISKSLGVVYDILYESLCVKNLAPSKEGNSVYHYHKNYSGYDGALKMRPFVFFHKQIAWSKFLHYINFTFNCNNLCPVIYSFFNQNFQRVILHRARLSSSKTDIMLDRCLRAWKKILKSVHIFISLSCVDKNYSTVVSTL